MANPVGAVILAGGQSERFGSDKAFSLWKGETFLRRVADALRGTAQSTLILVPAGARPEPYAKVVPGATVVPDRSLHKGPVEALRGAADLLLAATTLVVPCDAPGLTAEFTARLVLTAQARRKAAVAQAATGPLFALFAIPTRLLKERLLTAQRLEDVVKGYEGVPCDLPGLNVNEPVAQ